MGEGRRRVFVEPQPAQGQQLPGLTLAGRGLGVPTRGVGPLPENRCDDGHGRGDADQGRDGGAPTTTPSGGARAVMAEANASSAAVSGAG